MRTSVRFGGLVLYSYGIEKLEKRTSKISNFFLNNCEERDPSKGQGVHLKDLPEVEDIVQLEVYLYGFGFFDGEFIGELAR